MAARDGEFGFDQIHHFVTEGLWSSPSLQAVRLQEVDRLAADNATYLVIDDAALSKKGDYAVGVAAQYVFEF
jgi:SRSO17 transposase